MCQKTPGISGSSISDKVPAPPWWPHLSIASSPAHRDPGASPWPRMLRAELFLLVPCSPVSGKVPKNCLPLFPSPHPSASYHSRISYVKVGPNFVHPAARRNFPSPQELLQFQDAGARSGFGISPPLWKRGLSHGPAHPPFCLCSRSSLPLRCHSPSRDWQGQVEPEEVTQQVTGASRENRTFSSSSHPPNPKFCDHMETDIPLQVISPLHLSFFICKVRIITPTSKNCED